MSKNNTKLYTLLDSYYNEFKDVLHPNQGVKIIYDFLYFNRKERLPQIANLSGKEWQKHIKEKAGKIPINVNLEKAYPVIKYLFHELFEGREMDFSDQHNYEEIFKRIKNLLNNNSEYYSGYLDISDITWLLSIAYPEYFIWYDQITIDAARFLNIWPDFKKNNSLTECYRHFLKKMDPVLQWVKDTDKEPSYITNLFRQIFLKHIVHADKYKAKGTLYARIQSVRINNFLSIKKPLMLDQFNSNEIYLVGENGTGKTVLLQSILIAFKKQLIKAQSKKDVGEVLDLFEQNRIKDDDATQNALQEEDTKYEDQDINSIEGRFHKELHHKGKMKKSFGGSQYIKCLYAYGVHRNQRTSKYEEPYGYLTLFSQNYILRDPVLWLKDQDYKELKAKQQNTKKEGISLQKAIELLENLLENEVSIIIEDDEVLFKERNTGVTFTQLADGYKTVMIWMTDLLSRLMEDQPHAQKTEDFRGIVLVDELDLLLHPNWALRIMTKLRKHFPNIQFIISTHSPVLLLGASKDAIFYKVYKEEGNTCVSHPMKKLSGLTANALLTSPLWQLDAFTTKGTREKEINSDDYAYKLIHDELARRIQKEPAITEVELREIVQKKLDEMKNQGK